jgi:hypothetical protein
VIDIEIAEEFAHTTTSSKPSSQKTVESFIVTQFSIVDNLAQFLVRFLHILGECCKNCASSQLVNEKSIVF